MLARKRLSAEAQAPSAPAKNAAVSSEGSGGPGVIAPALKDGDDGNDDDDDDLLAMIGD